MTNEEPKEQGEGQGNGGRKPRGMGGVILILALLLALFVVVSQSGRGDEKSVHGFYHYLLNGKISKVTIRDHIATAQVQVGENERPLEIVLGSFLGGTDAVAAEKAFISALQAQTLDTSLYPAPSTALGEFLGDLERGSIRVLRAYLVQEVAGKSTSDQPRKEGEERKPANYLTALLQKGSKVHYVRLNPPIGETPDLQQVTAALVAKDVPLQEFSLSLAPGDFRVEQQNTALIYILGTIGPWLLVLAIVWFFIIRQMRSPGGSGGVLSFGRSRASLYTKENRTNITFDDVAGMEEAKNEVKRDHRVPQEPRQVREAGWLASHAACSWSAHPERARPCWQRPSPARPRCPSSRISGSGLRRDVRRRRRQPRARPVQASAREQPVHRVPRRDRRRRPQTWHRHGRRPRRARADPQRDSGRDGRLRQRQGHHPRSPRPTARTCSTRRCCAPADSTARSSSTCPT